jgi:hypothetical protein
LPAESALSVYDMVAIAFPDTPAWAEAVLSGTWRPDRRMSGRPAAGRSIGVGVDVVEPR